MLRDRGVPVGCTTVTVLCETLLTMGSGLVVGLAMANQTGVADKCELMQRGAEATRQHLQRTTPANHCPAWLEDLLVLDGTPREGA